MVSRKVTSTAVSAVVVAGSMTAFTGTAKADDYASIVTHVVDHPDNGHGNPSHWADDTFDRTTSVKFEGNGQYTVTLSGKGTFETIKNAGTPNGTNSKITDRIDGQFTGNLTASVTGDLIDESDYKNLDGNTYNDGTSVHYSTTDWIKHPS